MMNAMDVRRAPAGTSRRYLKAALGTFVAVAAAIAAFALFHKGTAGTVVDRASVVTSAASRGTLTLSIEASGVFAAENVRVVDAIQPGVVQSVDVKPGARVEPGDVIARMQNPDAQASLVEARSAVSVARAQLLSAQEQLKASALAQESALANAQAQMDVDATNFSSIEKLHRNGYVADETYQISAIKRGQSARLVTISRSQVDVDAADQNARVAAAQAELDNAQAVVSAKLQEAQALTIRAYEPGIVQTVSIDPGVRLDAGAEIATIADTRRLKAVLQVPETQVHDVAIGMPCDVDTGNGIVTGRIERIAPTAGSGSVAVDVAFDRPLPAGVRPSLNVNATIVTARLDDAVSIARPAGASDDSTVSLYRLDRNGSQARPVEVRLGRGSVDRIQVLSGLAPGDLVIVSDTSSYAGQPVLTLH
jgi:HlyD family secretion protein